MACQTCNLTSTSMTNNKHIDTVTTRRSKQFNQYDKRSKLSMQTTMAKYTLEWTTLPALFLIFLAATAFVLCLPHEPL